MNADTAEARRTAARHYLATVPVLEELIQAHVARVPDLPEQKRTQLATALRGRGDALERALIESFVRHFTPAELEAMARFYASPEGRSYVKKMPAVMTDLISHVTPLIDAAFEEFLRP